MIAQVQRFRNLPFAASSSLAMVFRILHGINSPHKTIMISYVITVLVPRRIDKKIDMNIIATN